MPLDQLPASDPDVTVTVEVEATETVSYWFHSKVTIPASVAGDPDALHDCLAEDEQLWLDDLDPTGAKGYLTVLERSLDTVALCTGHSPAPLADAGQARPFGAVAALSALRKAARRIAGVIPSRRRAAP